MKTCLLDANILLRFIVGDGGSKKELVLQLFKRAQAGEFQLEVETAILAETIYVLESFYEYSRIEIAMALMTVLQQPSIRLEKSGIILDSLIRYRDNNVDFCDALLAALAASSQVPIASFSDDFNKFKDIKRLSWSQ